MNSSGILETYNSGFGKHHITAPLLKVQMTSAVCSSVMVLPDLRAVFDTVKHKILLNRLGNSGTIFNLFLI